MVGVATGIERYDFRLLGQNQLDATVNEVVEIRHITKMVELQNIRLKTSLPQNRSEQQRAHRLLPRKASKIRSYKYNLGHQITSQREQYVLLYHHPNTCQAPPPQVWEDKLSFSGLSAAGALGSLSEGAGKNLRFLTEGVSKH